MAVEILIVLFDQISKVSPYHQLNAETFIKLSWKLQKSSIKQFLHLRTSAHIISCVNFTPEIKKEK